MQQCYIISYFDEMLSAFNDLRINIIKTKSLMALLLILDFFYRMGLTEPTDSIQALEGVGYV